MTDKLVRCKGCIRFASDEELKKDTGRICIECTKKILRELDNDR